MTTFSERHGFVPVREQLQHRSMDDRLRTSLWNALEEVYWDQAEVCRQELYYGAFLNERCNPKLYKLARQLWRDHWNQPIEDLWRKHKREWPRVLDAIRTEFFSTPWWSVYDFIEFVSKQYPDEATNSRFRQYANVVLEREGSAWRFVVDKLAPVISDPEIEAIEQAAQNAPTVGVRTHIETALRLLSDRIAPDYRNSIKESISAVEATTRVVTENEKATLGQAIKLLDERHGLHPAMKDALKKLYGYTSDDDGIRHALMQEDAVTAAEARFMLVICSAFVSFLTDPGPP